MNHRDTETQSLVFSLCLCVSVVQYRIIYDPPRLSVVIDLPSPAATFIMPRAIPMGYGEQPFDRFVTNLRAFATGGESRKVERQEGPRWKLESGTQRLEYEVDVVRMEQEILSAADTSKARPGYLGLLGYSVFGFAEGQENLPAQLAIHGPPGWPVLSTLAPAGGELRATNFYALADSQIVMGPKITIRSHPPLFLALYAEGQADAGRVLRLASEALEAVTAYFGGAPFPHYTVHLELLQPVSPAHRYGFSMEHMDSGTFYLAADQGVAEDARTRYNFAHHMAHSWIPKRSYGEGYFPFSWELAPLLDTIWLSEGWAQYAAVMALAERLPEPERAGYRRRMLDARFRGLQEAPPFLRRMPLVELSRVASTRYSEDFRTGRLVFSRGGLMAAEMDDHIRARSNGRKSMKDALRGLVAWTGRQGRGFRIAELPGIIREATGVDTRMILDRWLKPLE